MKNLLTTILLFINVISCFTQNCSTNNTTITTNTPGTLACTQANGNEVLSAQDMVTLTAGTKLNNSNTSGYIFTVAADHSIVGDANYNSSDGVAISATQGSNGSTYTLDNTDYAPGSIGGSIDVSPSGASTYSFPILVSPGTMGMQPSLSVVYSSQTGNDILGYRWHLSGLSTISRINKNPYYDGSGYCSNSPGVTFTSTDVFSLDGQRLIANPNASNTYSPENDPFTYITFDGNKFTVTTKDGAVMEYGNNFDNNNAQFFIKNYTGAAGNTVPYAYALDKVTDPNGNYIEYIYTSNSGQDVISTINYTGNSITGAKPYNSIYFYYGIRSDLSTADVAGYNINSNVLLTSIKVLAQGQLSKDYEFNYFYDFIGTNIYSKLNEIFLTADGISYNPTIVNWGVDPINLKPSVADAGATMGTLDQNTLYFGDFNNDGLPDIANFSQNSWNGALYFSLAKQGGGYSNYLTVNFLPQITNTHGGVIMPSDTNIHGWYVITSPTNARTNTYWQYTYMPNTSQANSQIQVYNYHGVDALIVHHTYIVNQQQITATGPNAGTVISYADSLQDDIDMVTYTGYLPYDPESDPWPNSCYKVTNLKTTMSNANNTFKYYYADFANTGTMDKLIFRNDTLVGCDGLTLSSIPSSPPITSVGNVQMVDINGDGIIEFMTMDASGNCQSYQYNGSTFVTVLHKTRLADNTSTDKTIAPTANLYAGDFNGDGKTDFLAYYSGSWGVWWNTGDNTLFFDNTLGGINNKGCNYMWNVGTPMNNGTLNSNQTQYVPPVNITIADMNNDGMSDIIVTVSNNTLIFTSSGSGFLLGKSVQYYFLPINHFQNIDCSSIYDGDNYMTSNIIYAVDLNNDGQKELVYGGDDDPELIINSQGTSLGPNPPINGTYKIITLGNRLDNSLYVNSITDGNNINSAITYAPAVTYSKGVLNYPAVPIKSAMYLATNILKTDLNTSTVIANTTYTFTDGYMHMLGKGFLGFTNYNKSDAISKESGSVTYNNTITDGSGNTCYYTWPSGVSTTRGNQPISSGTNVMLAKGGNITGKLFYPLMLLTNTTDILRGFTKKDTVISFDSNMGRVTDQKSVTSDGWMIETKPTYFSVSGNTSAISKVVATRVHGSGTFTSTTTYTYGNATYPFRVTSQTAQNKVTTNYTFDNYGNVTGTTVSVSDGLNTPSRSTSCVYDLFGRFKTSSTDITQLTSTAIYRPTDGAMLSFTDPNNLTTYYSYSSGGNSVYSTKTLPDGNVSTSTIAWDGTGTALITSTKSITNGSTDIAYINAYGQSLKESTNGAFNATVLTKTYTYNPDGTQNTVTDPAGKNTTYTYYPEGRLETEVGLNLNTSYVYSNNTSTVTDNIIKQNKTTITDALGNVTMVTGTTGEVDYKYSASGKPDTIIAAGSTANVMTYDPLTLDQLTLTDPDAGKITYTYNGFGQIVTQTDANGTITTNTYDSYGRLTQKANQANNSSSLNAPIPASSTSYSYSSATGSKGLLLSVTRDNVTENYTYDNLCRISAITVTTNGLWPDGNQLPATTYTYNSYGQLSTINYPSGLSVNYIYDAVGNISRINNANGGGKIWQGNTIDAYGRWTQFNLGNGLITNWGYNQSTLMLNSIQTGTSSSPTSIQNLGFTFNSAGQLTSRTDGSLSESFQYDPLNRLLSSQVGTTGTIFSTSFQPNGNITSSTLAGGYTYPSNPVHGVSSVSNTTAGSTSTETTLTATSSFNAENKTLSIKNKGYTDNFTYGTDGNRFRVDFTNIPNLANKVYIDNNEFGYNNGAIIYKRTIIYAPSGVCAVYQDSGNVQAFYYIHTDYMGSWLAITDNSGSLKNHYNYDAWGRRRDPGTWKLCPINPASASIGGSMLAMQPRFDRGYTGHEQMAGFALINMNGRMYDPYLQRFLSPDNEIQAPGDAQSYNRYTYCMNNPLMYTDPSGYTWFTQLGGWLGSTGRSIVETAVGIGAGIAAVAGVAALTVATGGLDLLAAGVITGMAAGISTGILSTAFSGGNGNDYLNAAAQGGAYGGITGFATSAVLYGICAGWEAIGNMHLSESPLGQDFWGTPNYPTSNWANNWFVKTYQFISNIGNGAANASIIGTTGGALASEVLSSALGSSCSQVLFECSNLTASPQSYNNEALQNYVKNTFPNEWNELASKGCTPTFTYDKSLSGKNTLGYDGYDVTPHPMHFKINPDIANRSDYLYYTTYHELCHALQNMKGQMMQWGIFGENYAEVDAYTSTIAKMMQNNYTGPVFWGCVEEEIYYLNEILK